MPRRNIGGVTLVHVCPPSVVRWIDVVGAAQRSVSAVEGRGRNGVNHAAPMRLFCRVLFVFSNACRQLIVWTSRQIRADLFPVVAAITCLPKGISSEEKQMRIKRRKLTHCVTTSENLPFAAEPEECFVPDRFDDRIV